MGEKNSFLKNTLILFAAMFLTKIIGAVLKIPLTNMLGGTGMGYFSTAYSFFNPVYTVLAAGLPTAVTKLTAQSAARKHYKEARKIKKVSIVLSVLLGVVGTIFILLFAKPFANFAASSPDSFWSVIMIAPSVLFCCVAAVYRGYYEGLSNMMPTALSQVIESVIKAVMGLLLSWIVILGGKNGYVSDEKVLPYAAAAAVLGVTLGELIGTVFLILRSKFGSDYISDEKLAESAAPSKGSHLLKNIILQSLPISFGAVIINLGSLIDLLTISGGIKEACIADPQFFISHFPLAYYETGAGDFGNFVYGSYTGIVLSLFMIITSLTSLVGKSALPIISAEYEQQRYQEVCRQVNILFSGIFLIGLPLCFSLSALSEPVLALLYPMRMAEVSVSSLPLSILCLGGIPISVCGGLFSVFQAVGRSDLPIKLMIIGSALKLVFNFLFLHIPYTAVSGAAISTVLSHAAVMLIGISVLNKKLGISCGFMHTFVKPFIAAASCALSALVSYHILFDNFNAIIKMGFSVVLGGTVYLVLILLMDKRLLQPVIQHLHKKRADT